MSGNFSSHALADAAAIGIAFGARMGGEFLIKNIDEIKAAAEALAAHESSPAFDWEHQGEQWPEVCAMLAAQIADPHGPGRNVDQWHALIRLYLKAARTAQLAKGGRK